jgi:hypothetical protein
MPAGDTRPPELRQEVSPPFRFVAYGDTRFTNPRNVDASDPRMRRALVKAIADAHPAFVSISGDIPYNGFDTNDWKVFDNETAAWRDNKIPVYPAIGNHELHGDQKIGLANYFQHFPELKESRYYSVRAANTLLLSLDSDLDVSAGAQADWLAHQLDTLPTDVDFVFFVFHHPCYTSSTDQPGGGHSARTPEQLLAKNLEARQQKMRARIVVFSGHVHNYERFEHGGVTYFTSGGGGAHPYVIARGPNDLYKGAAINYHYLLAEVDRNQVKITMNRVEIKDGKETWTQPDSVTIPVVAARSKAAGGN